MFFFGDPADTALTFWDNVRASGQGPGVPDLPVDEQGVDQLGISLAYCHMSIMRAEREGQADDVITVLRGAYDEVFDELFTSSQDFRTQVMNGKTSPPNGTRKEYMARAKALLSEL